MSTDEISGTGILKIVDPKSVDLGGLMVKRALPTPALRQVGPWVFFDHAGPSVIPAGQNMDVRPHPHINLATVTYLFDGEMFHRDSLGSDQIIRPGDINLMVAGRGIVHSERERPERRTQDRSLHLLQLWLALPEEHEETEPEFLHYPKADLPTDTVDGVHVEVLIGSAFGLTSPVKTFSDTLYASAVLEAGQSLTLPTAEERGLHISSGQATANGVAIPEHSLALLDQDATITIQAETDVHMALVGGAKLTERFIDWNFVSSSKDRISQAADDWRNQRFPTIPGDDQEFIPLPDVKKAP